MNPDDISERQELMAKVLGIFADCWDESDADIANRLALYLDVLGNCMGYLVQKSIMESSQNMVIDNLVVGIKNVMAKNKMIFGGE